MHILLYISILEFQGGRIKNYYSFKVKVVTTFLICDLLYDSSSLQDDIFESFHVEVWDKSTTLHAIVAGFDILAPTWTSSMGAFLCFSLMIKEI